MRTHRIYQELIRLGWSTLGIIFFSLCINLLAWKYSLVSGGAPGYALIVNYLTGFPTGTFLLILNTFLMILSFITLGKTNGLRAIYGYVFMSFFLDQSRAWLHLVQTPSTNFFFNLGVLTLQGVMTPIGIALALANGYSYGSYSTMVNIVRKYYPISPALFFLLADTVLGLVAIFYFGFDKLIYLAANSVGSYYSLKYLLPIYEKHFSPATV